MIVVFLQKNVCMGLITEPVTSSLGSLLTPAYSQPRYSVVIFVHCSLPSSKSQHQPCTAQHYTNYCEMVYSVRWYNTSGPLLHHSKYNKGKPSKQYNKSNTAIIEDVCC